MTYARVNGVLGVLSVLLASDCGPDPADDRTVASGARSGESLLLARPTLASIELSPASVTGGQAVTVTVALTSSAPAKGTMVLLRSSDDRMAPVPSMVLVAADASSASFVISTRPPKRLEMVIVTATVAGRSRTAMLRLSAPLSCYGVVCAPPGPCQATVSCNPFTRGCSYTAVPDGTACDDGNPNTGNDTCAGGTCTGTPLDVPSTPGDDRRGWVTCLDGQTCQDRCCRVAGPNLPWVCATGGECPAALFGQSSCDGPEDCAAGQVCCPMPDDIACAATCPLEAMCHTDKDCPAGQACSDRVGVWGQCAPSS